MDEDMIREGADEKLVNDAFQRLLDSYSASRHRQKVDIITKAFNFAKQAHKGVRRAVHVFVLWLDPCSHGSDK